MAIHTNIMVTDFTLLYIAILAKTEWYRQKNRYTDAWDRRDDQEANLHT